MEKLVVRAFAAAEGRDVRIGAKATRFASRSGDAADRSRPWAPAARRVGADEDRAFFGA